MLLNITHIEELVETVKILYPKEDNVHPIMADKRYLVSSKKIQFQVCFCKKCGNYCLYSRTFIRENNKCECKCLD
jgi:hypothetical protein